jgi:hypothetical protein
MSSVAGTTGSGGCLCGAVRYRVDGPLRDVIVCHCSVCRRSHGEPAAFSACATVDLELIAAGDLRWHDLDGARRGFCGRCGSRLFWQRDRSRISIAAGSLDEPTGLRVSHHIHLSGAGDWESPLAADGPPGYALGTPPAAST